MNMVKLDIKCPYCNFANTFSHHFFEENKYTLKQGYQAVYCQADDGGCDQPFAINLQIIISQHTNKTVVSFNAEVFTLVKTETPKVELKAA